MQRIQRYIWNTTTINQKDEEDKEDEDKEDEGKEDEGKEDEGKEDEGKEDGDKEDRDKEDGDEEDGDKEDGDEEDRDEEDSKSVCPASLNPIQFCSLCGVLGGLKHQYPAYDGSCSVHGERDVSSLCSYDRIWA